MFTLCLADTLVHRLRRSSPAGNKYKSVRDKFKTADVKWVSFVPLILSNVQFGERHMKHFCVGCVCV